MAQQDLVTLEHPDGRRYRTDSASEINLLVGSYGYRRVEQPSKSARASKPAAKPTPPSSAPAEHAPPEASSS